MLCAEAGETRRTRASVHDCGCWSPEGFTQLAPPTRRSLRLSCTQVFVSAGLVPDWHLRGTQSMSRDSAVSPTFGFLASGPMMQMDVPLFAAFRLFHFFPLLPLTCQLERRDLTEMSRAQTGASKKQGHQSNDCAL